MIIIGLIMLDVIKLNFISGGKLTDKLSEKFKSKGLSGSFYWEHCLHWLFVRIWSIILCNVNSYDIYSRRRIGFACSIFNRHRTTGYFFSFIIAYSVEKLGVYFKAITKLKKVMRILAGITFIITGLYYLNIYLKVL